jgi:hypothetical protein
VAVAVAGLVLAAIASLLLPGRAEVRAHLDAERQVAEGDDEPGDARGGASAEASTREAPAAR